MQKAIIIDVDGTISRVGDRVKHLQETPPDWDKFYARCGEDQPIEKVISFINDMLPVCGEVIFLTGRRESCRKDTEDFIHRHIDVDAYHLLMRPDGDHRHDTELKPLLLAKHEQEWGPLDVQFVLEDRNSMVMKWRELGYLCLQPADGDF